MDDSSFLAEENSKADEIPAIRSNLIYKKNTGERGKEDMEFFLVAVNEELFRKINTFYIPFIPVFCNSDCKIWNFISHTNVANSLPGT